MEKINKKPWLYIFECVMAPLYLCISYILLFTAMLEDTIPTKNTRVTLGCILGFYGFLRIYRAVKKYRNR